MIPTLYAALTTSPLWWGFLLFCLGSQLLSTRKKQPTRKLRVWQAVLIVCMITATFNLVYRIYPPAEKYLGALFFMGIAVALLLCAKRITNTLAHRRADSVTLTLVLGWLLSLPIVFVVSTFFLLTGLSILFFVH